MRAACAGRAVEVRRCIPHLPLMSEPLVVVIPHKLGKAEALRRIRDGLGRAKAEFASLLTLEQAERDGDKLSFCARSLGQRAHGSIEVYDAAVRLEVTLPW